MMRFARMKDIILSKGGMDMLEQQTEAQLLKAKTYSNQQSMGYIDCDIHHTYNDITELIPYLPRKYKEQIEIFGLGLPQNIPASNGGVGGRRADTFSSNGRFPGSDLPLMVEQHLDPFNIKYGILTGEFIAATATPDMYYSAALCSAFNDYTMEHWLAKDSRLRGSIYIPIHDPAAAVKEIQRLGSHPLMVQVMVPGGASMPYGQKFYHPVYEACERYNLPFSIHVGCEGVGINSSPTGVGYPSHYIEYRALRPQIYMAHMASLIFEGVFDIFPNFKVVFLEAGVFWVAPYLWRLNQDWRGLRDQTPWVRKRPSEYFQSNIYIGSQPIEEVPNNQFLQMMESVYARECLLFCSDYPHWDFDSPKLTFPKMDKELTENIFYNNAAALYGLPKNLVEEA